MKASGLVLASAFLLASASAQAMVCPSDKLPAPAVFTGPDKGVTEEVDLLPFDGSDELFEGADHHVRVRTFTIEPGGYMNLFPNDGRRAHLHVTSGTLARYSDDDGSFNCYAANDILRQPRDHQHWVSNVGDTPATIIATDFVEPGRQ